MIHRHIVRSALVLAGISLASCFAPPVGMRGPSPGSHSGAAAAMSSRPSGQFALQRLAELSARGGEIVAEAEPTRWSALLAQPDGEVRAILEREHAGYANLARQLQTPDYQRQIDAALAQLPPGPEGDRQRRFIADPYQHERFMLEVAVGQYWHATRRPALALDNLRRAYALTDDATPITPRLMAMVMLATTESAVGRFTAADRVARELRELATQTVAGRGDGESRAKPAMVRAEAANAATAASLLAAEAVRLAELAGDSSEVARLWTWARPRLETADPRIRATACFQFAHALAVGGNPAAAAEALAAGRRAAAAQPQTSDARYQQLAVAHLALAEGRALDAVTGFAAVRAAQEPWAGDSARPWHALALERAGRLDQAIALFTEEVAALEAIRGSVAVAERATVLRPALVARSYRGLMRCLILRAGPGDAERALLVSEQQRARQLRDALTAAGKAMASPDAGVIANALAPDEIALSLHLDDKALITFVVGDGPLRAAVIPLATATVDRDLDRWRALLADPASDRAAIANLARSLGDRLLAPVANRLAGKRRLIVVPDGRMNLVPPGLFVLPDGQRLVDVIEVALLPGLALLPTRPLAARPARLLAVGDPTYPAEPTLAGQRGAALTRLDRGAHAAYFAPLPETRREVAAVAACYPTEGRSLLLGVDASPAGVLAQPLHSFTRLHFACHGVLGGDVPGIDEPALVLSGDDGLLSASTVARLDLDADLVVLSACSTGAGEVFTGEGAMGMGRAFLSAGARRLIVSLWPVDSLATERLMVALHQRLAAGDDLAAALAAAQRTTAGGDAGGVRGFKPATEVATVGGDHPYYWSAFVAIGR